jgi:hypothetical protein
MTEPVHLPHEPLTQLGVALGLLHDADACLPNLDWFADPVARLRELMAPGDAGQARREALVAALSGLLREATNALGADRWLGLGDTGVRLIVAARDGGLDVGLGGRWESAAPGTTPRVIVEVQTSILHAGPGAPVAIDWNLRLTGSLRVELPPAAPLDALVLRATLSAAPPDVAAELVLEGLSAAGGGTRSLTIDLDSGSPQQKLLELGAAAFQVALQAIRDAGGAPAVIDRLVAHLLPLLGVDTGAGDALPPLRLGDLFADPAAALRAWFDALRQRAGGLEQLLRHLVALVLGQDALAVEVTDGVVSVRPTALTNPRLALLAWEETDAAGARWLLLGLVADASRDLDPARRLTLGARATLLRVRVSGTPALEPVGHVAALATLAHPTGGDVVDLTFPPGSDLAFLGHLRVKRAEAGLAVGALGRLAPTLALTDVRTTGGTWPRLDLTNLDAVVEVVGSTLSTAVMDGIAQALGDAGVGRVLATLAGLRPPTAAVPGWVGLDLLTFVADPLSALRSWFAQLLAPRAGAERLLAAWLRELRALLVAAGLPGAPAVTGDGSAAAPWRLVLVAGPPVVALEAWVSEPAAGRLRLQVRLVVDPAPLALGSTGKTLDTRLSVGLLDLTLPAPVDGSGAPEAKLLAGARFEAVLGEDLATPPLLGVSLRARRVEAALDWVRDGALTPTLRVVAPRVVRTGTAPFDLTVPQLDLLAFAGSLPSVDLPTLKLLFHLLGAAVPDATGGWPACAAGLGRLLGWWPEAGGAGTFPEIDLPGLRLLLSNPLEGLRQRLAALFAGVEWTPGSASLPPLELLWRWLRGAFAAGDAALPAVSLPPVTGDGTSADPWAIQVVDAPAAGAPPAAELLVWLDPAGPRPAGGGGAAPTHVGFGLRAALFAAGGAADGALFADLRARVDLAQVALTGAPPVHPTPAVHLELSAGRRAGYLLGAAGATPRLRSIRATLAWDPATGLRPDLVLDDAAFGTLAQARATFADAVTAPLLDALRTTAGSILSAGSPAGPALDVLVDLGLAAKDTAGWTLLADPLREWFDPATRPDALRARLLDPVSGAFRPQALQAGLTALGWTPRTDGGFTRALAAAGRHLDLLPDGTICVRTDAAVSGLTCALSACWSPLTGQAQGELAFRPGDLPLRVRLRWTRAGGLTATLEPDAGSLAETLLGGPLALWPLDSAATAALGERLLAALGRLATDLLVNRLADGTLLPALSAGAKQRLLALGLLRQPAPGTFRVAPLLPFVEQATGVVLDPTRLAGLEGTLVLSDALELALEAGGRLTLRTRGAAGLTLGDVRLTFAAGLRLASDPQPQATLALAVPLGPADRTATLEVGLDAAGPRLAVRYQAAAGATPLLVELYPRFSGLGAVAQEAVRAVVPAVLEGLLAALQDVGGTARQAAQVVETLLAATDAATGSLAGGDLRVDATKLAGLAADPLAAWHGTLGPAAAAQVAALVRAARDLADLALPGLVPALAGGAQLVTVPLGSGVPLALVVGYDAARQRFGVWVTPRDWATIVPGSPLVPASTSRAGVGVGPSGVVAELDLTLAVALGNALPLTSAVALTVDTSGRLGLALVLTGTTAAANVTFRFLPSFGVDTTADPWRLFRDHALPLLLKLVTTAAQPLLQQTLPGTTTRVGEVLRSAGLLAPGTPFAPAARADLAALGALNVAIRAAARALQGLSGVGDWVYSEGERVGVQVPATQFELVADPRVTLHVGLDANDRVRVPLLRVPASGAPAFEPGLAVRGLGLEVAGAGKDPLLDLSVLSLGAVLAALDLNVGPAGAPTRVGGLLELRDLRLPLGQAGGDSDPVASSLLSDGAENPGVTARVGYRDVDRDGNWRFFLDFNGRSAFCFEIGRQIGPLDLDRLCVRYVASESGRPVYLLLDGSFGLDGLSVSADDFGVRIPIEHIADPEEWRVTLGGLGIHFDQSGIVISGAFRRVGEGDYQGAALLRAFGFELGAIGAYKQLADGDPSLFIFAVLGAPLGGPPFFFVEGLAAGFGYNRAFLVPQDTGQIGDFPLLKLMRGSLSDDLLSVLQSIDGYLPAKKGAYWLAAGVKFSTFVFVKGEALLYVLLDNGFTVGLLGLARFRQPEGAPLVSIELAVDAGFSTTNDDPRLWVKAQLTDNSWLLTGDCKLTGGFALCVWFKRGDCVLSIGGYHPEFDWAGRGYPDVPRVGFRWQVSSAISIKGGAYFALTPREAMGGGFLEASGEWGPARAWFSVGANALIGWDPFYYKVDAWVSVGVEVDLWLFDLSVHVGVHLYIWGPKFGGRAEIDLSVVSFTVHFGASGLAVQPLAVGEFVKRHLLVENTSNLQSLPEFFDTIVLRGLLNAAMKDDADRALGTAAFPAELHPEFRLSVRSRMPVTEMRFEGAAVPGLPEAGELDLVPCNRVDVTSALRVDVRKASGADVAVPGVAPVPFVSPLPKALFLAGDDDQTGSDGLLVPADDGEPTVELADRFELEFGATPRTVQGIASPPAATAWPERDGDVHPLPFGAGGGWGGVAWGTLETLKERLAGAVRQLDREQLLAQLGRRRRRELEAAAAAPVIADPLLGLRDPVATAAQRLAPRAERAPAFERRPEPSEAFAPRLRARAVIAPTTARVTATPSLTTTTVARVEAARRAPLVAAPRLAVRSPELARVELVQVRQPPAGQAVLAGGATAALVADARAPQGVRAALAHLGTRVNRDGAALRAGVAQVYDFPGRGLPRDPRGARPQLAVEGDQAVRLLFLDRAGQPVDDVELGDGEARVAVPPRTRRVVAFGLGRPAVARPGAAAGPERPERPERPGRPGRPLERVSETVRPVGAAHLAATATSAAARVPSPLEGLRPGFGAVTGRLARGDVAACGADAGSLLLRVGPRTFAGRGAVFQVPRGAFARLRPFAALPAGAVFAAVDGLHVWLPAATGTLVLVLEAAAADPPDVRAAVRWAIPGERLAAPRAVAGAERVALLFPVAAKRAFRLELDVGAAYRLDTVAVAPGTVAEWARRLAEEPRWDVVEDGPLSPAGESRIRVEVAS